MQTCRLGRVTLWRRLTSWTKRSGRIDRYFSKVHRQLQDQPGPKPAGSDSHLHIEYPYLARTID
jgi:hypothetical protein